MSRRNSPTTTFVVEVLGHSETRTARSRRYTHALVVEVQSRGGRTHECCWSWHASEVAAQRAVRAGVFNHETRVTLRFQRVAPVESHLAGSPAADAARASEKAFYNGGLRLSENQRSEP